MFKAFIGWNYLVCTNTGQGTVLRPGDQRHRTVPRPEVKSFSEIKHAANYYGVRKGDLLYFVKKGASSPHHATIIAKVANNTLYYAAHSQPRKEHDAGKSIGTGHLWIVRMK